MGRGRGGRIALAVAGLPIAATALAIGYGAVALDPRPTLPPALDAERRTFSGRAGPLSYYVAGDGEPLLLLHSVNAAASAYEVGPLFDAMRTGRRVYAPDLPGFGFSDRSDRPYDIALNVDAVRDMLDEIGRLHPGVAVDAAALSLTSEFLARAETERPGRLRRVALVSPTGFEARDPVERRGGPHAVPGLKAALSVPLWSRPLFNWLTTRRSLRFFLEKTWGRREIDERLLDYDWLTTHQPGSHHAPIAFVSGSLFSRDIRDVYGRLQIPVLVIRGSRGGFGTMGGLGWAEGRSGWRIARFDTGALPHFERPAEVSAVLRDFLDEV